MNGDSNDGQAISVKEVYPALVQLVIHADSIRWIRFYNFLMANSILVLAWATIFAPLTSDRTASKAVLVAICLLGGASGVAWAGLAVRGSQYLYDLVFLGKPMESGPPTWPVTLTHVKPLFTGAANRDMGPLPWSGSGYLLVFGSLAFTVLYSVMLVVSVGWCLAAVPLVAAAVAIVKVGITFSISLRGHGDGNPAATAAGSG